MSVFPRVRYSISCRIGSGPVTSSTGGRVPGISSVTAFRESKGECIPENQKVISTTLCFSLECDVREVWAYGCQVMLCSIYGRWEMDNYPRLKLGNRCGWISRQHVW